MCTVSQGPWHHVNDGYYVYHEYNVYDGYYKFMPNMSTMHSAYSVRYSYDEYHVYQLSISTMSLDLDWLDDYLSSMVVYHVSSREMES